MRVRDRRRRCGATASWREHRRATADAPREARRRRTHEVEPDWFARERHSGGSDAPPLGRTRARGGMEPDGAEQAPWGRQVSDTPAVLELRCGKSLL